MKQLKWLDKNAEILICGCLLTVISVIMMLQVIMRYIFNSPLSWPEELSRYCYIWITFLSIGLTIRTGSYFRVTALIDYLPAKARQAMEVFAHVINLVFYGICAYYSVDILHTVYNSTQTTPSLRLPMYIIYIALPLGMFLSTFRSVEMLILSIRRLFAPNKEQDDNQQEDGV